MASTTILSDRLASLVHPRGGVGSPGVHAFGEPKGDLLLGVLNRVTSVADVASNVDAEVAADGAGGRLGGLGGT